MATTKKTAAKPAAAKSAATRSAAAKSAKAEPVKKPVAKAAPKAAKPVKKAAPAKKSAAPATKTAAKKPAAPKPETKPAAKKPTKPAKTAPAKKTVAPVKPTPAKSAVKKTAAPAKPAPAKKAAPVKPSAAEKAAIPAKPAPAAKKPAAGKKKGGKDSLSAEEKARAKKLREALALLREDKEWPAFLEQQRQMLMHMRDELAPNMQSVTRDHLRSGESNVSSSSGQHIGDAGSEAEVRDLTIRLLDKDREQLFEIDAALERIRRGVYGICEISLELIPKKRLQVRPFCRLTVKCQEEYEKKYGFYANYRARSSDHVGYADLQNDMENAISLDESEE